MSLMNTKPRWFPTAVATNRGWVNPNTGEVLIAIGNLKNLLASEGVSTEPQKITSVSTSAPAKRKYTKKLLAETVEVSLPQGQQIIGEVVEQNNANLIAE